MDLVYWEESHNLFLVCLGLYKGLTRHFTVFDWSDLHFIKSKRSGSEPAARRIQVRLDAVLRRKLLKANMVEHGS